MCVGGGGGGGGGGGVMVVTFGNIRIFYETSHMMPLRVAASR